MRRVTLRSAGWPTDTAPHNDALHAVSPSCKHSRNQVGYPPRLGISLRLFHQKAGHSSATAGPEVTWDLIGFVESNNTAGNHHIVVFVGSISILIRKLGELRLELAHFLLETDDV